jgi:hypothetical protein
VDRAFVSDMTVLKTIFWGLVFGLILINVDPLGIIRM